VQARLRPEKLVTIAVLALVAVVFLHVSASNPPGFYRDESANTYNASFTVDLSPPAYARSGPTSTPTR
jgi:hypothetical protein